MATPATLSSLWSAATIKSILVQSGAGIVVHFDTQLDNGWFMGRVFNVGSPFLVYAGNIVIVSGDQADWSLFSG